MGRKPFLVVAPLLSAVSRSMVLLAPSNITYVLYRLCNLVALLPAMQAVTAYLADIFGGRGSERYITVNKQMWMILAMVRIIFTYVARRLKSKTRSFQLSIVLNVASALSFYFLVNESLKEKNRKKLTVAKATNPFRFITYFSSSEKLQALAFFTLAFNFPMYNNTHDLYRRRRFNWTLTDTTNMVQISNLCEVLAPFLATKLSALMGGRKNNVGILYLYAVMSMVCDLNRLFTQNKYTLYLNPIIMSLIDVQSVIEVLISEAKSGDDVGEGEFSANYQNLSFPLGLVLPTVFSEAYVYSLRINKDSALPAVLQGNGPLLLSLLVKGSSLLFLYPRVGRLLLQSKSHED